MESEQAHDLSSVPNLKVEEKNWKLEGANDLTKRK